MAVTPKPKTDSISFRVWWCGFSERSVEAKSLKESIEKITLIFGETTATIDLAAAKKENPALCDPSNQAQLSVQLQKPNAGPVSKQAISGPISALKKLTKTYQNYRIMITFQKTVGSSVSSEDRHILLKIADGCMLTPNQTHELLLV